MEFDRNIIARKGVEYLLNNKFETWEGLEKNTGVARMTLYRIIKGKPARKTTLDKIVKYVFDKYDDIKKDIETYDFFSKE